MGSVQLFCKDHCFPGIFVVGDSDASCQCPFALQDIHLRIQDTFIATLPLSEMSQIIPQKRHSLYDKRARELFNFHHMDAIGLGKNIERLG